MSEKRFGVGVVGAGAMGQNHLRNFAALPDFEIRAVADADEARAREQAERFGARLCATGYREIVECPDVDVVVVAIPTAFHAEVAIAAAQNGKHIFCEKPLALTVADGERMIQAAQEAGVKLALNFQLRFHNGFRILREWFRSGKVARPVFYVAHAAAEVRPKLAMHDDTLNRGPVVDLMCHTVDVWRCLFESDPVRVYARGATFATGKPRVAPVERLAVDTALVVVEFGSGDVGAFHVSWGLPEGTAGMSQQVVYAPNALLQIDPFSKIRIALDGKEPEEIDGTGNDPLVDHTKHFAAAVRDDLPVETTGQDGLIALKTSLAALESAATGRLVEIAEIR